MAKKTERDILINMIANVKGLEKFHNVNTALKEVDGTTKQVTATFEKQEGRQTRLSTVTARGNEKTGRQVTINEQIIRQAPRFRAEYLGIMFAGMALTRATSGLVQTSAEWLGIQELISLTTGITFLPIMEDLLIVLTPILEWFMDLPEPAQKVIGSFVLLAGAIGAVAGPFGQIMLAMNALEILKFQQAATGMGAIGTSAGKATGKVSGLNRALKGVGTTLAIGAAISFTFSGLSEEELDVALGKLLTGGIAAGVAALMLGIGAPAAIAIGGLTFLVAAEIKFQWFETGKEKFNDLVDTVQERVQRVFAGTGTIGEIFTGKAKITEDTIGYKAPTAFPAQAPVWDFAVGTQNVPKNGLYRLHEGEQVIPKHKTGGGGVNLNVTYNVTVSDKRELETMFRANNQKLVSDIRRLTK